MTLEMSNPTIATREGGGTGRERGGEGGNASQQRLDDKT